MKTANIYFKDAQCIDSINRGFYLSGGLRGGPPADHWRTALISNMALSASPLQRVCECVSCLIYKNNIKFQGKIKKASILNEKRS